LAATLAPAGLTMAVIARIAGIADRCGRNGVQVAL